MLDALRVKRDFVAQHPDLIAHIPKSKVDELTDGFLMREAYRAYWQRNLVDAQKLFRQAFKQGIWKVADLKYLIPALLPGKLFSG